MEAWENSASIYAISIQPSATNVSNIAARNADSLRYNLQGQRVSDSYRGIIITNGKKYAK